MFKKISAFILCLSVTTMLFAEETVKLATGDWPPFHTADRKDKGIMSRVVTEAFAQEGVTVQWKFFPWERAKRVALSGEFDGSASWEPDNLPGFHYSDPTFTSNYVFFYLKSKPFDWKNVADLKGKNIGATIGYGYGNDFDSAEKDGSIKVERADSDETNYKKLMAGRIDIFPNDPIVGYIQIAQTLGKDKVALFETHPKSLRTYSFHLVLNTKNPKNKTLMEKFNAGLKKLKASGQYDSILKEIKR